MDTQDVKLPDNDAVSNLPYDEEEGGFNLHDLLPDELKEAIADISGEEPNQVAPVIDEPTQSQVVEEGASPQPIVPITEDSEEINFSPESIDKLIDGDINALNAPQEVKEEEEELPYWAEEEEYKGITEALQHTSYTPEVINNFIRKVADKSVVDNSQLTNNLRKEVDTYKRQLDAQAEALAEATELKKAWYFDKDPEIQAKYHSPIQSNNQKIDSILRQEGAKISVDQVNSITNKATLLRTLQENGVDDTRAAEVLSEWRARQDTIAEYNTARNTAVKNAEHTLSSAISESRVKNIIKNSLLDMVEKEEYTDIKEALKDGIDKHPDISSVLIKGRNNFSFLTQNMRPEQLHDEKLMSNVASYALSAANAERKQFQIPELEKERDNWKETAIKVTKAYKKLASSAGGIQGRASTPAIARARAKEEDKSAEQLAKEWEDRLRVGDDTPMGKQFFPEDDD